MTASIATEAAGAVNSRETGRLQRELRRHRRQYDERHQQRKYLEIAGMRKRHVQQAQHQRDPRRRQLDAASKARPRSSARIEISNAPRLLKSAGIHS